MYFRVVQPMHFPVPAEPKQFLSVRPGEPNLWVFDETGSWVVRRRQFPEGKLWTVLADLLDKHVIQTLSAADDFRPPHPLPIADVSSPPTLRVIRRA